MASVSISLTKGQEKELKDYATKRLWTFSMFLKEAAREYIENHPVEEKIKT